MNVAEVDHVFPSEEETEQTQNECTDAARMAKIMKITKRVIAPYVRIERKQMQLAAGVDTAVFRSLMPPTGVMLELLYHTVPVLRTAFQCNGSFLYKVKHYKNELVLVLNVSENFGQENRRREINIPIEEGVCMASHAAWVRHCLSSRDARRDRRWVNGVRWAAARAALAVPIVEPTGACYGVIQLYNTDDRTISTAISKVSMSVMRSSFYLLESAEALMPAEVWDDGCGSTHAKHRHLARLVGSRSPAALVAETGKFLNIVDAYNDSRFAQELDPASGCVTRSVLAAPVWTNGRVSGILQVINKVNGEPFELEDEDMFRVFIKYLALIINFYKNCNKELYVDNANAVAFDLIALHGRTCSLDMQHLAAVIAHRGTPRGFTDIDYCFGPYDDKPATLCFMLLDIVGKENIPNDGLIDFVISVFRVHSNNAYHNIAYATSFTHAVYVVLKTNPGCFTLVERFALMLTGLMHAIRRPPYTNSYLAKIKHPTHIMYGERPIECLNTKVAKNLIENKKLLRNLSPEMAKELMVELSFAIQATDCFTSMQVTQKLQRLLMLGEIDWSNNAHRYYAKGDKERQMGYTPCKEMDQRWKHRQPELAVQMSTVVALPTFVNLYTLFPNTADWLANCRKNIESWREEVSTQGQRLWRQEDSLPREESICGVSMMKSFRQVDYCAELEFPTG